MDTATLTDAQFVLASAADPNAFDHHAGVIYQFAWRRVGTELAKDVTAETFSIAFERRAGSIRGVAMCCRGCSESRRT